MKSLKQVLFDEYGGFADKRIKNIDKGKIFIADDRAPGDYGADHQLFSYFCMIFVEVVSPTLVKVTLRGNVPVNPAVHCWGEQHAAEFRGGDGPQPSLEFEVPQGRHEILRSLAAAIRSIVAPSAPRYSFPSYKYVCPRTADSLDRLATTLETAWSE